MVAGEGEGGLKFPKAIIPREMEKRLLVKTLLHSTDPQMVVGGS